MKRKPCLISVICFLCSVILGFSHPVFAKEAAKPDTYPQEQFSDFHAEDLNLYAQSAVLIDCENQRILYGKNANTPMPNASTTKILTCILALEEKELTDVVTVSEYACSMPKVKLGFSPGEQFYLEDLLYSLMLESHNDTAVAIAEHVAGSVEGFAVMMNRKAQELGCRNSHFVTPNGLDREDEGGAHSTTAYDLSLIMSYCIQNPQFLAITQTPSMQIQNIEGNRSYSLTNHNALLGTADGVISGKTGFTGAAGYCYVGACQKEEGRTYAFALLACGWPNNRSYKWSDSKALIAYADEHYAPGSLPEENGRVTLPLKGAVGEVGKLEYPESICAKVEDANVQMLLSDQDVLTVDRSLPEAVYAPVQKGSVIGKETVCLNGYPVLVREIRLVSSAKQFDMEWCTRTVIRKYFGYCRIPGM